MEKKDILESLKQVRDGKKRKFSQSVDLIVNLKDIDLKKNDQQVDFFAQLPHAEGSGIAICALVGPELKDNATANVDTVIEVDDFPKYTKDKKLAKALAEKHQFFIAQANIMPQVATAFGRVLGPKGKMPNPKAGGVVPPKADLAPLVARLKKTRRVSAKTAPVVHTLVGTESLSDEDLAENILNMYKQVLSHLPNEEANVKSAFVKLTMGKPVKVR